MRQSVLNSPSTKLEIEKAMQAKLVAEALSGSDANISRTLSRTSKVSEPKDTIPRTIIERDYSGGP